MSINDPMMESKHHLPECPVTTQRTEWGGRFPCFCVELRAAEQRVTSDFAKYLRHMVDDDKFAAGVKAAREAIPDNDHRTDLDIDDYDTATEYGLAIAKAAIDKVVKP